MSTTDSLTESNTLNPSDGGGNPSSQPQETNSSRELKIFKKVIRDPVLRAPFQEFLEQQFCAENLNFYLAVEQFKEITEFQERVTFGRRIFDRYFAMNSTEPVNIDNSTSKRIRETVDSGTFPCDTYDVAQYQILHLLKYDCWPRFLRSTSNTQPTFTDEELAADDEEKNGNSQPTSITNTSECEASAQPSMQSIPSAAVACTKEKRKSILWHGLDRFSRRLRRGDSNAHAHCLPDEPDVGGGDGGEGPCVSAAAGRGVVGSAGSKRRYIFAASKQYSMPAEMTSPVKKNSLSPTHLRRKERLVEAKQCQLMVGDQFNTETVILDDPTMSVRRWTQEMADSQGMDRLHVEVVDAETGSTIDPARQAIDALQSRALRLVPVVSFIVEFLPPNFSFKNPATTPTKLVCVRARQSLSMGAVLRPLLLKYISDPNIARIVMNGSLEQIKRSVTVGLMAQKCLVVMSESQYNERVAANKMCMPAPRDPILLQHPSVIYEQNNFQFHQHGDISYCEIPSEAERNKHAAHQQHFNDIQNAAHQQKEYSLSLFNKFVRKASHAVSKNEGSAASTSNVHHHGSGSGAHSSSRSAATSPNQNSASASGPSPNNGETSRNRLSIFKNFQKADKKGKGDLEKSKAKSEDVPTTSSSLPPTSASARPSLTESKPNGASARGTRSAGPNSPLGADSANVRHPAIFSTKVENESTGSSLTELPITLTAEEGSSNLPQSTTLSVSPPIVDPPIPTVNVTTETSPVRTTPSKESTWQTAAYV